MSDEQEAATLSRLTAEYPDLVFVRKQDIGAYWAGDDGQPTGEPLERFDNAEEAEAWAWERYLAETDQTDNNVRP